MAMIVWIAAANAELEKLAKRVAELEAQLAAGPPGAA